MYSNVFIPYKDYWSSPFSRWQMLFQNAHAIELYAGRASGDTVASTVLRVS